MKTFGLKMLTPEKVFFDGEVESLNVEAPDGKFSVLKGHSPTVIAIQPSVVEMTVGGEKKVLVAGEGFVTVTPVSVTVLAQTLEWPEDIEAARAKRALEEGSRDLRAAKTIVEHKLYKGAIARAMARLKVK